ncbi:hypothetical protein ACOMHN_021802 [Nucella lapillus]
MAKNLRAQDGAAVNGKVVIPRKMARSKGVVTDEMGTQWGDEAKGKVVDMLATKADVCCRCQPGDKMAKNLRAQDGAAVNGKDVIPRKMTRSKGVVTVVLGTQWGDEGKGKVVDMLATKADVCCRCQPSDKMAKNLRAQDGAAVNGKDVIPRKMARSKGVVTVVLGTQWGDEGKGKVVDMLATKADVCCRCQPSDKMAKNLRAQDGAAVNGKDVIPRKMTRSKGVVTVALGTQWGDKGKGKVVDMLATKADVCCRCRPSDKMAKNLRAQDGAAVNGKDVIPRKMARSKGVVTVVLGTQWGDEAKGKVVDMLATKADVCCRCQKVKEVETFLTTLGNR